MMINNGQDDQDDNYLQNKSLSHRKKLKSVKKNL